LTPLTVRPSFTSRQGMIRFARSLPALIVSVCGLEDFKT